MEQEVTRYTKEQEGNTKKRREELEAVRGGEQVTEKSSSMTQNMLQHRMSL
jgi:hypothetical protein